MASIVLPPRDPEGDGELSDASGSMESELDKNRARLKKLERIKRKLKDRDSRLSVLEKESNQGILDGSVKPYETRPSGGEADSKEAVRVLSYAAFKLQRQVDKKTDEALALRKTVDELEETLQEREKERSTLSVDMNIFRRSLQAYSDHIDRLALELDTKNKAMEALIEENDHHKQQAEEMKDRLAASRKDYEWMRAESMSKREQLEYFDFQLLSKNDEIDKLHQELDQKLRRIVELEVDMELVGARSSHSPQKGEGSDSDVSKVRSVSFGEAGPAAKQTTKHSSPRRIALFRLRELKCESKAEGFEARGGGTISGASSAEESHSGSFPTDMSTDTTAVMTRSTDGSSPCLVHRTTGKKSGRGAKPPPNQQYIDIIDNLRADLLAIEEKYKQEKYGSAKLVEKLKQENNEYLIKLVCMDNRTRDKDESSESLSHLLEDLNGGADNTSVFEGSVTSGETPVDANAKILHAKSMVSSSVPKLPNKSHYLEKKVESLEGENLVQKQTIEELESKLAGLEKLSRDRAKADKRRIDELTFQNEAQKMHLSELKRGSRISRSYNGDQDPAPEYAATLEDKIQKQSAEISGLHLENDLKDRVIETLRSQLVDQRTSQRCDGQYAHI